MTLRLNLNISGQDNNGYSVKAEYNGNLYEYSVGTALEKGARQEITFIGANAVVNTYGPDGKITQPPLILPGNPDPNVPQNTLIYLPFASKNQGN